MQEKFKFKNLTKEQILISADRLTRFKYPKNKYFRVFSDIISNNLIEPKYKKSSIQELPANILKNYTETIINESLSQIVENSDNSFYINQILLDYENKTFILDDYTKELIDNKINYNAIINLIAENDAVNLKWLKSLKNKPSLNINRRKYRLKFPIEMILLVEGITEEILLPVFSNYLGLDFYKEGIQIIPAGGKNQVVKMYYELSEELKIPIFLLLDKDAEDNINQIKPKLRETDKIHLVSCGEFEDLLPKSLILKTLNNNLNNFATVANSDFDDSLSEVKNLENIYKRKGLHEFKKADFAKNVKTNINEDSDISSEIAEIIMEIGLMCGLKQIS